MEDSMNRLIIFLSSFLISILIIGSLMISLNIQNAEARGDDICASYEPLIEDCMDIIPTNCFCEIIVTPELN